MYNHWEGVFGIQQYSKHCLQKQEDILKSAMPSKTQKLHVQSIKRVIKRDLN